MNHILETGDLSLKYFLIIVILKQFVLSHGTPGGAAQRSVEQLFGSVTLDCGHNITATPTLHIKTACWKIM